MANRGEHMTDCKVRRIRLPQLVTACVLAVAVALGVTTFLDPATASARKPWNDKSYWNCVAMNIEPGEDILLQIEMEKACCDDYSGGWNESTNQCDPPATTGPPAKPRLSPGDLGTAPSVTHAPLHPIPPGLISGDAPTLTQAPDCPPENSTCTQPPAS